jgi:hypothetical protein
MPGLMYSQSELEIVPYLLVDTGGTLVEAGAVDVSSGLLQPVSIIPIARPSNTIRVDILFIGKRNFYQNPSSDKQNISIVWLGLFTGFVSWAK